MQLVDSHPPLTPAEMAMAIKLAQQEVQRCCSPQTHANGSEAGLLHQRGDGKVAIRYSAIPGLPGKQRSLFESMDKNADHEVCIDEITALAQERIAMKLIAYGLAGFFLVSLLCFFGLAVAGAILSQTTELGKGNLVRAGSGATRIVATFDATQQAELNICPVLNAEALGQIQVRVLPHPCSLSSQVGFFFFLLLSPPVSLQLTSPARDHLRSLATLL